MHSTTSTDLPVPPRCCFPLPPPPSSAVSSPAAAPAAAVPHHEERGAQILALPISAELVVTFLASSPLSADRLLPHLRHLRISLQPAHRCEQGHQGGGEEDGHQAGEQLQRGLLHHGRR